MSREAWSEWESDFDLATGRGFIPVFPADSFVPDRICPHMILDPKTGRPTGRLRPMAEGERRVCMGCHQSGYDDHPAMKPNPLVDPRPEPAEDDGEGRPDDEVGPAPAPLETRKQRRARLFDELNREAVRGR